jgi:hypothetical protein
LGFILYYNIIKDHKKHYEYTLRYLAVIEQSDFYIIENPKTYIGAISNFLSAAINLSKFDSSFHESMKKLEQLYHNPPYKTFATNDVKSTIFSRLYINKLLFYEKTGQFESTSVIASAIESGLSRYRGKIGSILTSILHFNLACNYFGFEKYHIAIQYLNKIINAPGKNMDLENLFYYSKMLTILSHFELGNYELLEYLIKSTHRMLMKRNEFFKMELFILEFIKKKLLKPQHNEDLVKSYMSTRTKLLNYFKKPSNKERVNYFDYISWIESKIKHMSYAEVVREKMKAEVR